MGLRLLVTTVGRREDADRLARFAIEQGLAACVHIEALDSVYRWQGTLTQEPEWRLTFKTTVGTASRLRESLRGLHPYALPAWYSVAPDDVDPAFLSWVESAASAGPRSG